MILESVTIGHLRCLEDCHVRLDQYVAVIGANGVGKSTVLEALRFVLDPDFSAKADDWNACAQDNKPLSVTINCKRLNAMEQDAWGRYVDTNGSLALTKIAQKDEAGAVTVGYRGVTLRHRAFDALYETYRGNKNTFRGEYTRFRTANRGYGLDNYTRSEDMVEALRSWEGQHTEQCERLEVDYDAKDVESKLYDSFRVVYVPAVSPVQDTVDGKGSMLSNLINQMLWRDVLAKPQFIDLQRRMVEEYRAIFPTDGETELDVASALINRSLQQFAPGSTVQLGWKPDSLPKIAPPTYRTVVTEDGVSGDIERKGNGVQRALVVAVLNALNDNTNAQHPVEGTTYIGPTTLLLVEEPELYQHPTRARHFARSLSQLAVVDDNAPRMQVVVTTHSPYFVSVANFEAVRLLRRERDGRQSPRRRISEATLEDIWAQLRTARGYAEGSNEGLTARARLAGSIDIMVREGFFADAIVLTEGSSDAAAVTAGLARQGVDADARGIAILDAGGVGELDKLLLIFRAFEIPTFVIWDGDVSKGRAEAPNRQITAARNRRLLGIVGAAPVAFPTTTVANNYAVFEEDRETTLRVEFGADYDRLMDETCTRHGWDREKGEKVATIVQQVYDALHALNRSSGRLDALCAAIAALVP